MPPKGWYEDEVYGPDGPAQDMAHGPEGVYTKARVVVEKVTREVAGRYRLVAELAAAGEEGLGPEKDRGVELLLLGADGLPIPDGEPLYILRGRNVFAGTVLQMYRDVIDTVTGLDVDAKAAAEAELDGLVVAFEKFETEHADLMGELV